MSRWIKAMMWFVIGLVAVTLAIEAGPWVGRRIAGLDADDIGFIVVAISVLWLGRRLILAAFPHPSAPPDAPFGRAVIAPSPEGKANPATSAAHEAGHVAVCLAVGLEIADVTLDRVRLSAGARQKTVVEPVAAWHRLVVTMAGRAGQLRVGDHTLASGLDNRAAQEIATILHQHRADLPVSYSTAEELIELARVTASEILDGHAELFDEIRMDLVAQGRLTADELPQTLPTHDGLRCQPRSPRPLY